MTLNLYEGQITALLGRNGVGNRNPYAYRYVCCNPIRLLERSLKTRIQAKIMF